MGADRARVAGLSAARRSWPLVVRRARASDAEAVLAFASATWDGWDYIPHAWPVWLTADDGVLLVASAGRPPDGESRPLDRDGQPLRIGRALAVARVALTAPSETWLEGIRVDPRVRGMDVATDLQVAELAWAAAQGTTVVRYATGSRNEGSHRLGARHGFRLLASFRTYSWNATSEDDREQTGFDETARAQANAQRAQVLERLTADRLIAAVEDAREWWKVLRDDATFRAAHGLYEHRSWTMQELSRERFAQHVQAGEVIATGTQQGPSGWALAIVVGDPLPAEDVTLNLALLAGHGDRALKLVELIGNATGQPMRFRLPEAAPLLEGREKAFAHAGFRAGEWTLDILERSLDPAEELPEGSEAGLVLEDEPAAMLRPPM